MVSCELRMEFIGSELHRRYPDYRSDLFELDAIVETDNLSVNFTYVWQCKLIMYAYVFYYNYGHANALKH